MPPCWIGRRKQKVVISSFCSSSSNVWFHSRYPLSRDWLETSNTRYSWSIEWLLLNPTEIDIFAPVLQPRSRGRTRCDSLWFLVVKSTKRTKLISHVTVPNWGPMVNRRVIRTYRSDSKKNMQQTRCIWRLTAKPGQAFLYLSCNYLMVPIFCV